MNKRHYTSWVVSQIISGLSKTPEQEIINIKKGLDGSVTIVINGETEVTVRSTKKRGKK